jgi:hypothetical protein
MRSPHRTRIGGLLLAAIGALAILALPGAAAARDRNHDRIPDRWEKRHHLSLRVNQAHRDQDGDRLDNMGEFQAGDNPHSDDTDGDGVPDGEENAGTIASFDATTGKLTIDLFGGETASGLVTEETEIECGDGGGPSASTSSDESDDPPGHDGSGEGPDQGEDDNAGCTTAALVPGSTVTEAELQLQNGVATFEKVELNG